VSLRPPRRIFRSSSRAVTGGGRRLPFAVWAGVLGAFFGLLIVLLASPAELLGRVPPLTGRVVAPPERVAVVDGETLVLNQTVIRLDGLAAPARGQACHGADGAQTDCGAASAAALASLVRAHDVSCRLVGRDREGFPRGICEAAGVDLNRALVAAGWARARPGATGPVLATEEATAKAAGLGLWNTGAF
jgi:endonuclease YncB( thermonuclease family)